MNNCPHCGKPVNKRNGPEFKLPEFMLEEARQQMLACIRRYGERGLTKRELPKFSRKFAVLDQANQANVLSALDAAGEVALKEIHTLSGKGRKRVAYVATAS